MDDEHEGPFKHFPCFLFVNLVWFPHDKSVKFMRMSCETKTYPSIILFTSLRMANFKIYLNIIYSTISIFNFDFYFNVTNQFNS